MVTEEMKWIGSSETPLQEDKIRSFIAQTLGQWRGSRVLLVHPDYTRQDFSHVLVPILVDELRQLGMKHLYTLNASGTHRPMTNIEIRQKLGIEGRFNFFNHEYGNPEALFEVGKLDPEFVSEKTMGEMNRHLPVTVNKLFLQNYDLIVVLSSTIPHEATGFSGGLKTIIPGIAGPDVVGLFHWAAVLIGIPQIIGSVKNTARDIINAACEKVFRFVKAPVLFYNMVFEEKENCVVPRALYAGWNLQGALQAYEKAAEMSEKIHTVYIESPLRCAVQVIGSSYDEIWTAGKGSYKLQKPGVMQEGGEIIIFAPHIKVFHSNPLMDNSIREIGYQSKGFVQDYLRKNPGFDRNVAAHVINVRGPGSFDPCTGKESFLFQVTLATAISEEVCRSVGLGYRSPASIVRKHFESEDCLWIEHGGKYLYDLKREGYR